MTDEECIAKYKLLVMSIANSKKSRFFHDLLQEGYLALFRSNVAYHKNTIKKASFITYASHSISRAMNRYLIKNEHAITKPMNRQVKIHIEPIEDWDNIVGDKDINSTMEFKEETELAEHKKRKRRRNVKNNTLRKCTK